MVSDGYNNYEYDNNDIIKKDTIFNKDFKYYKNSIGYNNQTANYLNYTYMDNKFGDNKLKDDVYYGNIIYNLDSDISSVNSSNTTIMKYEDNFYPLSSNLLSIYGDSPISFLKQEYKLFYYDRNINNYATLLYGTKIRYNTNIGSTGQIRLQFKLENRNIDQLIIRLQSNYRDIYIYRNSSGFLVIRDNIGNQTGSTAILILSSVWYKMIIQIDDSLLTTKITFESTSTYVYQTMNISTHQNDNNLKIQLGKMDYYYDPMVTYGLIRNLFYSQSLSEDRDYINIYKSDSMMLNNEIKNTEIKINKDKVLSIDRIILKEQPREFDPNSNIYEKRSLSVNNNDYVFETYSFRDICYENHISITDDMIYSFEYDSRYRIIKEKVYINSNESYNYSYSYDNNENIVSWSHTAGNNVIKSILYNYNNQYKMILDSIIITENNQAVLYQLTYDNTTGMLPVSFMGNSYSYEGYNLITYNNYNYEYNVYGKRIRKYNSNINMNVYYYYDKNNNLIIEDGISYKLKFLYDCSNNLYGFVYDTTNNWSFSNNIYLYLKDETGIIWGIVDSSGNLVGKYNYNAYGYIISVTDYDQSSIVNINPIRYKSYYYDTESNMYYLSSRYYNPLLARFMTPDSFVNVEKTGEKTYNLYAYCFNNPTSFVDSEGNFAILAARLAIIYFTSKELEKKTRKTIEKIEKMEYKTDDNNVTIIDSYKISSPFEIFIGAFYFKYIKKETKGIIKGSVLASTFEWMIHNMAYQIGFEKEPAKDVSLGPTIFDDNHGFLSFLMCSSYILVTRNFSVSDILINLILKITGM